MQKIERNFLIIIIVFIIVIIICAFYNSSYKRSIDRNSYVELVNGVAFLNDIELQKNKKEKLKLNDIIKTSGNDTLAIIEWGDGSVTRLGGNTTIKIENLFVSSNKDKIQIAFNLLEGKTWSNVVSFIPDNSYFLQTFKDIEAAVRGTIFNVDLEKDYFYVIENKVNLSKNSGESILVEENKPFIISKFSFIKLEEFIKKYKDITFEAMNLMLDMEMYIKLQDELIIKIKEINNYTNSQILKLSDKTNESIYGNLLSIYQDINFVSPNNKDLYEQKINLKEKLIEIAPEKDKKLLLDSLASDFKNVIKIDDYKYIGQFSEIFMENIDYLSNGLKTTLNELSSKIIIPNEIKETFIDTFNQMKNMFNLGN